MDSPSHNTLPTENNVHKKSSLQTVASQNINVSSYATARATYLRILIGGIFMMIILIFAVFSIYWASLFRTPVRNLPGWIVDFDGGLIGQAVTNALTNQSSTPSHVTWHIMDHSLFPGGVNDLMHAVREQKTWVALSINNGASALLNSALSTPNATYNGSTAITVFADEARNENAFRTIIRPSAQASLDAITHLLATQLARQIASSSSSSNISALLTTSPQTLVSPVSYTIQNLIPFDIPVATAVTFVGLLYQLILAFFIVMVSNGARETSQITKHLSIQGLIALRFLSTFIGYLFLALFYSLLSLAFQLDLTRKFGHAGFMAFWMLNWAGMLAVGLALESLLTLLTLRFMPFFMLIWIISNVSVCIFPIEVLPVVYRYGYVAPFYHVSHAMRTIIFGTKNQLGLNFGILIAWIGISCITLPLIQWWVSTRANIAAAAAAAVEVKEREGDARSI